MVEPLEALMTVIAVTREMGTLGKDVVQGVADAMGLAVVHHEMVEHDLAERLGMQESAVHRYLEGDATLLERWKVDKSKLSRFTAIEILELVEKGNVIIRGWGATALLAAVPHVLRVRICAPMEFREQQLMARLGLKQASVARREIERSDAAHARIVHGFFGLDWRSPLNYHAVLNTGAMPVVTCIGILQRLAEDLAFQSTEASRMALTDQLTEWRVRNALAGSSATDFSGISVDVHGGRVVLNGTCYMAEQKDSICRLVRGVPGVKTVEDQIIAVGRAHYLGGGVL
jgi:cytidylate kinase